MANLHAKEWKHTWMHKHVQTPLDDPPVGLLYQKHASKIFDYVRKHAPSFEDAEDILVEVFVAALENKEIFEWEEKRQHAWLWRVAHNKINDLYRRAKHWRHVPLSVLDEDALEYESATPEQMSVREEEDVYLHALVRELSPLQQEILRLRFADDLRSAEIASRVGKQDGAVRSILSRTLNQLRRLYEKQ